MNPEMETESSATWKIWHSTERICNNTVHDESVSTTMVIPNQANALHLQQPDYPYISTRHSIPHWEQ